MPIRRCPLPGKKSGWKFGDSGKCYPTKKQADKQRKAIEWSKHQEKKK